MSLGKQNIDEYTKVRCFDTGTGLTCGSGDAKTTRVLVIVRANLRSV